MSTVNQELTLSEIANRYKYVSPVNSFGFRQIFSTDKCDKCGEAILGDSSNIFLPYGAMEQLEKLGVKEAGVPFKGCYSNDGCVCWCVGCLNS